ncbi:MAG: GGDEF domain-containing protein, partial [Candidatus Omnitrophica bacterium]|nr:GGDEF domain-containing protein [Candidatus Omnitrophota bacterium]
PLPVWINYIFLFGLGILPGLFFSGERPFRESLLVALIGISYFTLMYFLFYLRFVGDFFSPLVSLFFSAVIIGTYNFVRISLERQNFFKMAVTDELTSLFNIRYFKMLLEAEIAMAKSDPTKKFVIIMSDIDHFKYFNDTYGHQTGDLVLREVAKVIKESVRSSDVVARYGGEENIILLRGASLKDGLLLAEKIRKNIEQHTVTDKNNVYKITASFGVATFRDNDNVETVIRRADEALYKAKNSGRNRVETVEKTGPHSN